MSDKFSFLKRLSQKVRPQDFDGTDDLATVKKTPQTKVDSSGKKRVVISDDSDAKHHKVSKVVLQGLIHWELKAHTLVA